MRLKNVVRVVVALALLSAFGCSSNNKGKIEGTKWSSKAGTVKGTSIPAGMLKLEFTTDGKMTYTIAGTPNTGTYSLGMGDTVNWNFDRDLGDTKRKRHAQKCVIKGNIMTVSDSDGTSLDFEKVVAGGGNNPNDKAQ